MIARLLRPCRMRHCQASWSEWITAEARARGCPADYVAAGLIAGASAWAGNARHVGGIPTSSEPPHLWFALIGAPSTGKTPALRPIIEASCGPTLSVRDGDRALIVKCFAGCPAAEVLAELRRTGIADDQRRDYQEPVARAAVSTLGIAGFLLRSAVREVIIMADDRNGAGEHAVRGAAERWLADGRRVRIATPPASRTDFNDLLLGGVDASVAGEHHV
jgi:Protein of unknown function (DUF3987)/Toprim domain